MRAAILALVMLAGCGPSFMIPPPSLRHEPTRPFVKLAIPSADMANACRGLHRAFACSTIGTVPLRILPNDVSREETCLLTWHENGHINEGWLNHQHIGWDWSTPEDLINCLESFV